MSNRNPSRAVGLLGGLLALTIAACGGTSAAPARDGDAGRGGEQTAGDASAALQAAFESVVNADSFTYEATVREYGTYASSATTTGTIRTAPVEASIQTWTSQDGTTVVHLIHDGTLWLDGGDGRLTNVGPVSDSIRDQQAPYLITEIWDQLDFQLEDYEVVGEEAVGGVTTTHYRLVDFRREQAVEIMKIPASQYSADIWVDAEGVLRKVFRGVQADESGEPTKGSSVEWALTALDCECPVEPPAE
jgi:hypothetical protein